MPTIDLNCDMGESYGRYSLGQDQALLTYVTSVNIACGYHAGDPLVMRDTVRLALEHGAAIGAHPGYPDLQGFGRRAMDLSAEEVEAVVLYQIGALAGFARAAGAELTHVKPHGALYNQAAKNWALAQAVARGTARFSKHLILVGLAGSLSLQAGSEAGLRTASEGFPERGYTPEGTLIPRSQPGALIESPAEAAAQAVRLAQSGLDTLCIHGDSPHALEIVRAVQAALAQAGFLAARLGG